MALTDEAIVKIKEMITSGELGPGDRLPKEADLASRLGLSRNSLREAVKALTLVNVLDVRHGDGTFVTSLDSAHLLDALSFMVDLHRDDSVLQFFEVRRLLEPGVAALAAGRISKEQLEDLRNLTGSLTPSSGVDELVINDLRFHRGIAEATGNAVVCSLLDGISGATQRARIWRGVTQARGGRADSGRAHRDPGRDRARRRRGRPRLDDRSHRRHRELAPEGSLISLRPKKW
ncbi:FadR/GntR family transcriptional regulator [Kribbella qitaiheensis]|uniref:FadR/GntR family transcriptional regulator n=1 Tax=Kribbella qitaiheensis TaxID=1544730 RepID=UPI001FE74D88|nr:FCD domain-containing protein [Kribbella qitaiheensis]